MLDFKRFLLGIAIFIAALSSCSNSNKPPVRFVVPQGYAGWVHVRVAQAGERMLPTEDNVAVAKVPAAGQLATASTPSEDTGRYEFFEQSENAVRPLPKDRIWGLSAQFPKTGDGIMTSGDIRFFVGGRADFEHAGPQPSLDN